MLAVLSFPDVMQRFAVIGLKVRKVALWRGLALGAVMLMGSACAPHIQTAMTPPSAFAGPRINERELGIGEFVVQDGARLPFRRWAPEGQPKAVIIALHGFNDHSSSWRMAGPWWAEQGIEVWAYDQRGFGASPNKGIWSDPELSREDLRTVTALVRGLRPDVQIAIAGESMGGALAISAFASQRPPQADRLVLLAPAVWGWSNQNPVNRVALWAGGRLLGSRQIEPPSFAVRHVRATDNVVELLRNGSDPRFILDTRIDALHGLVSLMEEGFVGLESVRVPTLLAYGAHDMIVPRKAMRNTLQRAGEREGFVTAYYPDGWHILNRDMEAQRVFGDVEAWITGCNLPSQPEPVLPALLNSDN